MKKSFLAVLPLALFSIAVPVPALRAQQLTDAERRAAVGDSPLTPRPLAQGLSSRLTKQDVDKVMKKVADWQIGRVKDSLSTDWTFAVLEAGLVAASDTLNDSTYRDAVKAMGEKNDWTLGPRRAHGDDQVVGQSYLGVYARERKPEQIAPLRRQFDQLKGTPDDPQNLVWWWCDALFMAPPVWAGLYRETGDRSYLDYMDRQWWLTSDKLYNPQEHLFSRDAKYLTMKEANGRKVFWLRGNGWVMGGLVRVLQDMPADYPTRPRYESMLKEMAQKLASLQGADGLWRTGLLNQDAYPLPETSGSALVTYALAWGVNHGILDRAVYHPVIQKAWTGLVSHVYQDGRLGCVQPVGERPDAFRPTSSYVYGVGAFLLAGSELHRMAEMPNAQAAKIRPASRRHAR